MSVVGFTFGSFGDIITLIQLANAVRNALSNAHGSAADCQDLISCLDGFSETLEVVRLRLQPQSISGSDNVPFSPTTTLSPLEVQTIRSHLARCHQVLNKFSATLKPYRVMVDGQPVNTSLRQAFLTFMQKLRWVSFKGEAANVEKRLTALMTSIILVVNAPNISPDRALSSPRGLYLTDLLDCPTFVPIEMCTSLELFHTYMRLLFKERKGRTFVYSGNYRLFMQGSGQVVTSERWRQSVHTGKRLLMSALVNGAPDQCPNCRAQNNRTPDSGSDTSEIRCSVCNTFYKHLEVDQGLFKLEDGTPDGTIDSEQPHSLPPVPRTTPNWRVADDGFGDDDISFVRRIATLSSLDPGNINVAQYGTLHQQAPSISQLLERTRLLKVSIRELGKEALALEAGRNGRSGAEYFAEITKYRQGIVYRKNLLLKITQAIHHRSDVASDIPDGDAPPAAAPIIPPSPAFAPPSQPSQNQHQLGGAARWRNARRP